MEASYPERFKSLLDNFQGKSPSNYIGQGNPGANLLIIGKEGTAEGDNYNFEIVENFEKWRDNFGKVDFNMVNDWDPCHQSKDYNPLFPYNTWRFGGKVNKNKIRHGSLTWDGYQTLINEIYPEFAIKAGEPYNLWKHCFVTDLSICDKRISNGPDPKTAESIEIRLHSEDGILRHEFFQQFPIIILAVYQYKDWYNIDIEKCFNQNYIGSQNDEELIKHHEFIHKHLYLPNNIDLSNKRHPRLLIHTNHAVYRGCCLHSKAYYKELGKICRDFLEEYYRDNFAISK